MPQRHSKNNNDLAFFTYDEKKKLGYGTQRERLGRDSIKPFDACCLCLKPFIDPMCCQKGHVFCKECILECLLSQKKDIHRFLDDMSVRGYPRPKDFSFNKVEECDVFVTIVYYFNGVFFEGIKEVRRNTNYFNLIEMV
ncbi:hypothetical protein ACFX2J_005093 [Malus domestica]